MDNREIDTLIAEKIFGQIDFNHLEVVWREDENTDGFVCPRCGRSGSDNYPCTLYYSTSISAAWQVVNHLLKTNEGLVFHTMSPTLDRVNWYAGFGLLPPTDEVHFANADTVEVAICLAALKAIGVEIK